MLIGPGSGTKRRGGAGGKRGQTWRAGNAALMSTSRWVEGCRNGFRCYGKGDVGHGREHRIIPHRHYRHSGRRRQSIVGDEDPDLPIHLAESRSQVITVSLAGLESTAVLYLTAILPSRSVILPPPLHIPNENLPTRQLLASSTSHPTQSTAHIENRFYQEACAILPKHCARCCSHRERREGARYASGLTASVSIVSTRNLKKMDDGSGGGCSFLSSLEDIRWHAG